MLGAVDPTRTPIRRVTGPVHAGSSPSLSVVPTQFAVPFPPEGLALGWVLLLGWVFWKYVRGATSEAERDTELTEAEKRAALAARQYLRDERDPTTVEDLLAAVYPAHAAGYEDERRWWIEAVGPELGRTPTVSVPRREDGTVATSGVIVRRDGTGAKASDAVTPDPDPGERFGYAVLDWDDGTCRVRVSDGDHSATVEVHDRHDLRIDTWSNAVDDAWLADAREYVHDRVTAGRIELEPGADDGSHGAGEPGTEREPEYER